MRERALKSPNEFYNKLIIIGASVGGPNAILNILSEFQSHFTPVIIIQHIFKEMVEPWVSNLKNKFPHLNIKIPQDGESIRPHHIYIAEGGKHCKVEKERKFRSYVGDRVNFVIPSSDITFISAAKVYRENLLGIVLTGAGRDGAFGAKKIKEAGGKVFVEHKSTCVVDSMSKAVIDADLADKILPLHMISSTLRKEEWIL